jgi:hypothetical protein
MTATKGFGSTYQVTGGMDQVEEIPEQIWLE